MKRLLGAVLWVGLILALPGLAQDEKFQSGPQPAPEGKPPTKMPGSFEVHTFNGKHPGRFHCLVCENDIHPTLILFLKEPGEGKDGPLKSLLEKLDGLIEKYEVMDKYPEVTTFAVYAVFMSEAAQTSLNNSKESDPAALVKEATARRALYQRMKVWSDSVKKVVVACAVPETVKNYKISPAAEVTGLYYESFNVLENFAFEDGSFKEDLVATTVGRIEGRLQARIASLEAAKKKRLGAKK